MCDARPRSARAILAIVVLAALSARPSAAQSAEGTAAQSAPTSAAAQARGEAEALRAQLDSARARTDRLYAARRSVLREENSAVDTAFFEVGAIRVLMFPKPLPTFEQQSIARGIARGLATLESRHGELATALVDTAPWLVGGTSNRASVLAPVALIAGGSNEVVALLKRPVSVDAVETFVLDHAGARLRRLTPAIPAWIGERATLADTESLFERAARELAVAWAGPARRCAQGAIEDCRRTLVSAPDSLALSAWFDTTDHRRVVVASSGDIPPKDRTRQSLKTRCLGGDDTACTQLARTLRVRYPHSTNLRATVVREAFALGDTAMLARLRADSSIRRDPMASLARAAGVSEDSLLRAWWSRGRAALDNGRPSAVILLLVAAGWSLALLALAATRRAA